MALPASKFFGHGRDYYGFVRFGFVPEHEVLIKGLDIIGRFLQMEELFEHPRASAARVIDWFKYWTLREIGRERQSSFPVFLKYN